MNTFSLTIVTPDGLQYEGQAEELIVRTVDGDLGILAGHINCVSPLGMGMATVKLDGEKRYGACIGGMVSVLDGGVKLVPTTFEWADQIDTARAIASGERAKRILSDKSSSQTDIRLAEARLKRALIRQSVAQYK
ncbi:MAG: ATP synthase F1 subunit epsilon [Oscillospiraceae bacterium]|nr:ATP synthase F1 subunit epsilon [Oscillospiraceae bacterium]MBQ8881560.1 ATP synthase F1 subunit epsilon [Oscillospiraceae bacterium]